MHVVCVPNPLARSATPNEAGVYVPSAVRTTLHLDEQDGLDTYTQDVLTVPASLTSLSALSVPVAVRGKDDGWPLGVSVVG
jgi:aspartyl-tRNA(Asn)/glutamyl-tRNA(Gln) amidotransferase subunit A